MINASDKRIIIMNNVTYYLNFSHYLYYLNPVYPEDQVPFSGNYGLNVPELTDIESFKGVDLFVKAIRDLRVASITSFFMDNQIDVPSCFKKSRSLYNRTYSLRLLKFTNFQLKSGKRGTLSRQLSAAIRTISLKNLHALPYDHLDKWHSFYNFLFNTSTQTNWPKLLTYLPSAPFSVSEETIHFTLGRGIFSRLFRIFDKYKPLFSFYVRKVDKSVRKHSRGKSGKYKLLWKYIPPYKRFYTIARWFTKDINFNKADKLGGRFIKAIESLLYNPRFNYILRIRRFVHSFVFQNCKKTLFKTLKSTS